MRNNKNDVNQRACFFIMTTLYKKEVVELRHN
jgi:hypothetical protein